MAISRAGTASNGIAASGATIPVQTGVVNGDLMLVFIRCVVVTAISPPSGWTQIYHVQNTAGAGMTHAAYYRIAASEPSSYTWSNSAAGSQEYILAAYSGVNSTIPIDTSASDLSGATTTVTAPAITTSYANGMIVGCWCPRTGFSGAAPYCNAAFSTVNSANGWAVADLSSTTAGGYGGWAASSTAVVARWVAGSIALRVADSQSVVPHMSAGYHWWAL